jgi:choline kinase
MKAIILAAGRGSRLMPYTENTPKCLTELDGKPLIRHQIDALQAGGVEAVIIVTGYQRDALAGLGAETATNSRWAETNMVESLFCAEESFGNDIVVCYSDIVFNVDVVRALLATHHDISVVVDRQWRSYWQQRFDDPLSDAESLTLDAYGRITDIGNPVVDIDTIEAQYIGLMRFKGRGIETLARAKHDLGAIRRDWMDKRSLDNAYMTDLLMEIILRGHAVHAVPIDAGWLEIDTVEDYELATRLFADGRVRRE